MAQLPEEVHVPARCIDINQLNALINDLTLTDVERNTRLGRLMGMTEEQIETALEHAKNHPKEDGEIKEMFIASEDPKHLFDTLWQDVPQRVKSKKTKCNVIHCRNTTTIRRDRKPTLMMFYCSAHKAEVKALAQMPPT